MKTPTQVDSKFSGQAECRAAANRFTAALHSACPLNFESIWVYRKYLYFVLAVTLFYATEKFCHRQTDGFQIVKVVSHFPSSAEWEMPKLSTLKEKELRILLSQPFHYLDSGGQCYAFLSQDKKVVLKLFKMHHLKQYPWLYRIALPGVLNRIKIEFLYSQKQKLKRIFASSKIAYNELKKETGLLHLSLNPQKELSPLKIKITDKLGIAHALDPCNTPFVLQHRADNAFRALRAHLMHKDIDAAKNVIKEVIDCLKARYQKGIKDLDPAVRRNIGLLEERAIAIDIGSFFHWTAPMSLQEQKRELADDTRRMRKWLKKRSYELTIYFDSLIEDCSPSS